MKKLLWCTVSMFAFFAGASAQDFQSLPHENDLLNFRTLGFGIAANVFDTRPDNSLPDSLRIKFSTPMMFLEYRQMDIRIALCYSRYDLHSARKASYAIYADGATNMPIVAARSGGLFLPIIIATNYVRAEGSGNSSGIFDVGSIGIGTGLTYRYLLTHFGLQVQVAAVIHYSTVGFSIEHGSSSSVRADMTMLFPNIALNGIVAGYRLETQQWRMTDEKLNYRRLYHGAFIGLFF